MKRFPQQNPNEWLPYGFAHGSYTNRCATCERSFMGAKGSIACWECANKALLAERAKPHGRIMTPETSDGVGK